MTLPGAVPVRRGDGKRKSSTNPPMIKCNPPWLFSAISVPGFGAVVVVCGIASGWSALDVLAAVLSGIVAVWSLTLLLSGRSAEIDECCRINSGSFTLALKVRAMTWPGLCVFSLAGVSLGWLLTHIDAPLASMRGRALVVLVTALLMLFVMLWEASRTWSLEAAEEVVELSRPRGFYVIEKKDIADNGGRTVMGIAVPAWVFVDGPEGQYVIRGQVDLPLRGWKRMR